MAGLRSAVLFLCLLLCISLCLAEDVEVTARADSSIAKTDENFVCVTLDWWPSDKCDYNMCPWGEAGILNLDLDNKILENAMKAFNPLRVRIGGSLEDQVVYKVGEAVKNFPHFKKRKGGLFGFTRGTLTMDRWAKISDLLYRTNSITTFGLNVLIGKKNVGDNNLYVGDWDYRNAGDFMAYNAKKGYKIESYELGNELTAEGVSARLTPRGYAKDLTVLKKIVKKLYPDPSNQPKVIGPAGFYDDEWFRIFLQTTGPDVVDVVTHHVYNLGAGVDPNLINKIQDPFFLNEVAQTYRDIAKTVSQFGPWAKLWMGETGGAYNSGGKDVQRAFVDGFWYIDQLGMTSTFNHQAFCRQALIGGNYGLLNTTTFIPNPDYYGALLWHRLMGTRVLRTSHDSSPYLRAYTHCSRSKPGVTVLLINMSNSTSFDVKVKNDENLYPDQYKYIDDPSPAAREEYHLTPKDGNILSDVLLLNGETLQLTSEQDIPPLNPKLADPYAPIRVAPDSIVFATLRGFRAPA